MTDTTPAGKMDGRQHAHDRQRLQHTARRGARQPQPPHGSGHDCHPRASAGWHLLGHRSPLKAELGFGSSACHHWRGPSRGGICNCAHLHPRCVRQAASWLCLAWQHAHGASPHARPVRPVRYCFAGSRPGPYAMRSRLGSRLGSCPLGPAGPPPSRDRAGTAEGVYRKRRHKHHAGRQQHDGHCAAPSGRAPPWLLGKPQGLLLFGVDPMNRAPAHHAAFSERCASATEGLSGELPGPRPPLRAAVSPGGRGCDLPPVPLGTRL